MKIENTALEMVPLNLAQIRINGHLIGSNPNVFFPLQAWHIEVLEMLQRGFTLQQAALDFLNRGTLISFNSLKDLVQFLVQENIILNHSLKDYFNQAEPEPAPTQEGILNWLFVSAPEEKSKPISEQLLQIPFLRSLRPEMLSQLLGNMEVLQAPPKVRVCQKGQTSRSLFCLLSGQASVYKDSANQNLQKVATLNAGSLFGEAGFFLGTPRTATVVTDMNSTIVKFHHRPEIFDPHLTNSQSEHLQKRFWLIHALLHSPIFKNLPDDCFDALLSSGQMRSFQRGQRLTQEGQAGNSFFILIQGELSVSQNQITLRRLGQGDGFGEMALMLTKGIRTASVTSLNDSLVLEILSNDFYRILSGNIFLACEFEKVSYQYIQEDRLRRTRAA